MYDKITCITIHMFTPSCLFNTLVLVRSTLLFEIYIFVKNVLITQAITQSVDLLS